MDGGQDVESGAEPAESPAAVDIWVADPSEGDAMGLLGGDPVLRSVPLGPLRNNLAATVEALQRVFGDVAALDGALCLSEAQLSFEITATGGVQLIGTGQLQGSRGLTLTFRRQ
jgi:hypothetical protein